MKTFRDAIRLGLVLLVATMSSCKKEEKAVTEKAKYDIDSTQISAFFQKHPDFKDYSKDIYALYKKHNYRYVWYDKEGRHDFADVLYNRASQIEVEGVPAELPYQKEFSELFDDDRKKPDINKELLISSMYFFYTKKVYDGLDPKKSQQTGWYLPRGDKISYVNYLDELMRDYDKLMKDEDKIVGQYYNLRRALYRYRKIRDAGGWGTITLTGEKPLKPGDSDPAIAQIRKRLAITGEIATDSKSPVYDDALRNVILAYRQRQSGEKPNDKITPELVKDLNISVEERIKTIIVNMERCRWIDPEILDGKEVIAVNIPSYRLTYFREGEPVLQSNVVVGKVLNKTVVFSGSMSYLVFSPYWNVPKSIVEKEIMPELEKNPNYLEEHNMEWNDEEIRQRPGDDNSLGLVKFMFPNQNNIYLHDTPAKSLFKKDDRAYSHGCVRVEKARELAHMIMKNDQGWSASKVDEAMHLGTEQQVGLKRKIAVYIAYFTASADKTGNVTFYDDVYKRDARLAHLLYTEETK